MGLIGVGSAETAYVFAGLFGLGIGGVMTLLPMAWADYFGRESYGAIRGVALSLQVVAQAAGRLASGLLRDASGAPSPARRHLEHYPSGWNQPDG